MLHWRDTQTSANTHHKAHEWQITISKHPLADAISKHPHIPTRTNFKILNRTFRTKTAEALHIQKRQQILLFESLFMNINIIIIIVIIVIIIIVIIIIIIMAINPRKKGNSY